MHPAFVPLNPYCTRANWFIRSSNQPPVVLELEPTFGVKLGRALVPSKLALAQHDLQKAYGEPPSGR